MVKYMYKLLINSFFWHHWNNKKNNNLGGMNMKKSWFIAALIGVLSVTAAALTLASVKKNQSEKILGD